MSRPSCHNFEDKPMTVPQTWLDDCRVVQAILRKEQPLAMHCHCGPHCMNLVTQAACVAYTLVRDSMGLVHEMAGFFNLASSRGFSRKSQNQSMAPPHWNICSALWTVCTPAIRSVLSQYESVLTALEEMASCSSSDTSTKANGLHGTFLKGNTVLGLVMAWVPEHPPVA